MTAIYASVSITAPTLGIIIGGFIINKLGGYENNKVPNFLLADSFLVKL